MCRVHPFARLLTVHGASGSSLPVYRNMFYRALSNAAQINSTESLWHESSTSSPSPLQHTGLKFDNNVMGPWNKSPKGKPTMRPQGSYYTIIAFQWNRFVRWTCRISEDLTGECQLGKIGLWQQYTEEVLMVRVISDTGFTLRVIQRNPERKSGHPEQQRAQVWYVSSTGWLKHSPPETGRLLYSSLIAIKGRGGKRKSISLKSWHTPQA